MKDTTSSVAINWLSEVWLKASILGANWAASEIILGSFLHNLHVPFKGNILTAIGLVLMISVSYIWKDKGLFWRSGLICALMKTMSPSAVIFGPMVAIFAESVLLDLSTRVLGRNILGFITGSILAMLWILFQRIINIIIFYGFNIVEIYSDLLRYAEKQLGLSFDTFWLPILILAAGYVVFGVFTAFVGVRIGKQVSSGGENYEFKTSENSFNLRPRRSKGFPYSITWLVFSFTAMVVVLILISRSPLTVWMPVSAILVTVWVMRYTRAMRQLSRPKFWISFAVITLLASLLISYFNEGTRGWVDGFITGLQMNFRAAVVVVGFAVLSTELYNPVIRNFLAGSVFKKVPVALEVAFESLPYVVANLPDARTFLKKPAEVIRLLVRFAEVRYKDLTGGSPAKVFIVTGDVEKGKTSLLTGVAGKLKEKNISVGGIYSARIIKGGKTTGYNIVSFDTEESFPYLKLKTGKDNAGIGRWEIIPGAIERGKELLSEDYLKNKNVVIIDEVGKLETRGEGWKEDIERLLMDRNIILVLSVRRRFVDEVTKAFNILLPEIIDVGNADAGKTFISKIMGLLNSRKS